MTSRACKCGHTLRVSLSCCRLMMCCCRELLVFCCCSCADLSCSCSRWHSAVTSHISISTHRHRRMQLMSNCWFLKLQRVEAERGLSITLEVSSCWWIPSSSPFREACCTRRELSCKQARTYDRCRTNNMDSTNIFKAQMFEIKRQLRNIQPKIIQMVARTHTCFLASAKSFLVFTSNCFILDVFSSPWSCCNFKASADADTHTHKWARQKNNTLWHCNSYSLCMWKPLDSKYKPISCLSVSSLWVIVHIWAFNSFTDSSLPESLALSSFTRRS